MRSASTVAVVVAAALLGALAPGCSPGEPPLYFDPYLGEPLDAGLDDPLLLTVAAPRARAEYLVDEGYTLTRDEHGDLAFVTDTAGDLGLSFEIDGALHTLGDTLAGPPRIRFTGSDTIVLDADLTDSLALELRFAAASSRVATAELWLRNAGDDEISLAVLPHLRRCAEPYLQVRSFDGGVAARHDVEIAPEEMLFGPGSYVDRAADALVVEGAHDGWAVLENCTHELADDVARLAGGGTGPPHSVAMIALRVPVRIGAGGRSVLRVHRALVPQDDDDDSELAPAIAAAETLVMERVLEQSYGRLAAIPALDGLDRDEALVYRSSFVLLDQLMMPAEGDLDHAYYVFSREPTWWFARLGQHTHESLAMLAMARYQPELAMASHRVFTDRVEDDGYLPYNVGPVVEQTLGGIATAPLLAYEGLRIHDATGDDTFLAEAYDAAARVHAFWVEQRDVDGDGLSEFGSGNPITESVRDLNNVIWPDVAAPDEVEAVDLNCWLAVEERSLATMAERLGRNDEATTWAAAFDARAARINETMWDEQTSFYYHVDRDTDGFSHGSPGDLKRMEIAGLMPLWAGIVPDERRPRLLGQLADPYRFLRPAGVPSLAADDPSYAPQASECCKWDGPAWVQWQYLLVRALLDLDEHHLAGEITDAALEAVTVQLAATHQFRELYDPDDPGCPNASMPNYVWSSLIALMMLEREEARR